jgi:hypothetical protein
LDIQLALWTTRQAACAADPIFDRRCAWRERNTCARHCDKLPCTAEVIAREPPLDGIGDPR